MSEDILFETLFSAPLVIPKFGSPTGELQAVASRNKKISAMLVSKEDVDTRATEYAAYVRDASALGLTVRHVDRPASDGFDGVYVGAGYPSDLWRLEAYATVVDAALRFGWADSTEFSASAFLGYDVEACLAWIKHLQNARTTWGCIDIYALLNRAQYDETRTCAGRYFPATVGGKVHISCSFKRRIIGVDALSLLPRAGVLCRVGLTLANSKKLLDWSGNGDVVCKQVASDTLVEISRMAESHIQVLTKTGWRVVTVSDPETG